jgi:hypothetical protein
MEALHHQDQLDRQYQALPEYCDYIAHICRRALLRAPMPEEIVAAVEPVDNHVVNGKLVSSTKKFHLFDMNGKKYRVTVEAI